MTQQEAAAYRRIWVGVVLQAIKDAHGVDTTGDSKAVRALERHQARTWARSRGLEKVCSLAGLDAGRVRRAIEEPIPPGLFRTRSGRRA